MSAMHVVFTEAKTRATQAMESQELMEMELYFVGFNIQGVHTP